MGRSLTGLVIVCSLCTALHCRTVGGKKPSFATNDDPTAAESERRPTRRSVAEASRATPHEGASHCITDPVHDFSARLDGERRVHADEVQSESLADVDGDGQPETLLGVDCGSNCEFTLYLSGDSCPHYAGTMFANYVWVEPTGNLGVSDVGAWSRGGCGGLAGTMTVYRWNGARFESQRSINCECPEEASPAPRDPWCPNPDDR